MSRVPDLPKKGGDSVKLGVIIKNILHNTPNYSGDALVDFRLDKEMLGYFDLPDLSGCAELSTAIKGNIGSETVDVMILDYGLFGSRKHKKRYTVDEVLSYIGVESDFKHGVVPFPGFDQKIDGISLYKGKLSRSGKEVYGLMPTYKGSPVGAVVFTPAMNSSSGTGHASSGSCLPS